MKSVREVLNPVLLSIAPERGAFEAARAMAERRVHHLLVMRRGDLLGVVCSCDVKHVPRRTPVEQVMSRRLLTFPIDGSVEDAVSTMLNEHIGFLPVIEQGGVIGVITRGDLARALGPEHETSQMLACKWCQSHRHVNFTPKYAAPICDDCLADDPHDVGEGD